MTEKNYSAHITLELNYPLDNVKDPAGIVQGLLNMAPQELVLKCGGKISVVCEDWSDEKEI